MYGVTFAERFVKCLVKSARCSKSPLHTKCQVSSQVNCAMAGFNSQLPPSGIHVEMIMFHKIFR